MTQILIDDHKNLELGNELESQMVTLSRDGEGQVTTYVNGEKHGHECSPECSHEQADVFEVVLLGDGNDIYLKTKAYPIPEVNDEVRAFCSVLVDTMDVFGGIGIAAPQVGMSGRIIVACIPERVATTSGWVEVPGDPQVFVNPEMVSSEGTQTVREGCLSIPGVTVTLERPKSVRVRATNLEGEEFEVEAEGKGASVLCHELDHLDGILIFDRIQSNLSRKRALAKYAKSRRALFRGAGRVQRSQKRERPKKARKKQRKKKKR